MIAEIERTFRETIKESLVPRDELLAALTNRELAFRPSSANPTLGELCLRIGETQHSYAASFRTFAADFEYRYHDASIAGDIERLRNWHAELDAELEAALESLSQNDASRTIARDGERVTLGAPLAGVQRSAAAVLRQSVRVPEGRAHDHAEQVGRLGGIALPRPPDAPLRTKLKAAGALQRIYMYMPAAPRSRADGATLRVRAGGCRRQDGQ